MAMILTDCLWIRQKGKGKDLTQQAGNSGEILVAKSWELATSPAKQIPMQAIMLYMSGNTVQIFSMLSIGMLFKGSLNGIASTEQGMSSLLPSLFSPVCGTTVMVQG